MLGRRLDRDPRPEGHLPDPDRVSIRGDQSRGFRGRRGRDRSAGAASRGANPAHQLPSNSASISWRGTIGCSPRAAGEASVSVRPAGGILGGTEDFWKVVTTGDVGIPLFTTENRLIHVLGFRGRFGWAEEYGRFEIRSAGGAFLSGRKRHASRVRFPGGGSPGSKRRGDRGSGHVGHECGIPVPAVQARAPGRAVLGFGRAGPADHRR